MDEGGCVAVDKVVKVAVQSGSFVRIKEARGHNPGVIRRRAEQTFDNLMMESAVFIQENLKVLDSRSVFLEERMGLETDSMDESVDAIEGVRCANASG